MPLTDPLPDEPIQNMLAEPSEAPNGDAFDHVGRIARLVVYPIKSCGGVALQEAVLTETGLDLDRAWMVVDAEGEFVSQREYPRMALIQPQLKQFEMVLRAPGMLALHVQIDAVEKPLQARVWSDTVPAYDMGDVAAQWFSMFLTDGKVPLRLVRFDPEHQRLCSPQWVGDSLAHTQFADGFALLVCTEASMLELNARLAALGHGSVGIERFRPNIVVSGWTPHAEDDVIDMRLGTAAIRLVKPCSRCSIPNIDPATGVQDARVSAALGAYRSDARLGGAITFGMNAIVMTPGDVAVRVGDPALANVNL